MPISDVVNKHVTYTYGNGWKYEFWLKNEHRFVYVIHSGPMGGRKNYQACHIQEVRTREIFQISWLEETGTIVSLILDLAQKKITTFCAFSKGHWENSDQAHGDKRNPDDFSRWRKLANIGTAMDRELLVEQAEIETISEGRGDIEDIDPEAPTV